MYTTRIAPSPTGYFHLGTARTAYFNYLVAKATGGKFILRIDDTDLARNQQSYYDCIFDTFDWLGLKPDEIHYQSKRLDYYLDIAGLLITAGRAKEIDGGAIALTADMSDFPRVWNDTIAGDIAIRDDDMKSIDNLILIKSDGMPTYNFCSILDDMDLGVNWVIRGVDHIKNTPKQLAVIHALRRIRPAWSTKFTHVGLIHHNKKKMSKRDGALGVMDYKAQGYDPRALLNHVMKLGWGHPDPLFDKKYKAISHDDAVNLIMQGSFRSQAASHDPVKLDALNRVWKARV